MIVNNAANSNDDTPMLLRMYVLTQATSSLSTQSDVYHQVPSSVVNKRLQVAKKLLHQYECSIYLEPMP
ncbi:hypothetical protein EON65_22305 [archaeon]|nr:MAG: hypothetical protein EON65_22305 [archaeon]